MREYQRNPRADSTGYMESQKLNYGRQSPDCCLLQTAAAFNACLRYRTDGSIIDVYTDRYDTDKEIRPCQMTVM